jgi:hypothetical protein
MRIFLQRSQLEDAAALDECEYDVMAVRVLDF